jgi:cytolysin (calcineurin-like family phosphatase)
MNGNVHTQTKFRRNKMLRQIASLSALTLATVPMIAISTGMAFASSSPKVTVFNQGGYVADYQVSYNMNGQQKQIKIPSLVVGKKQTVTLPVGSTDIRVKGQMKTGLFWEPLREIFNRPAQDGSCFKTYGTIFKSQWSTQCTADF